MIMKTCTVRDELARVKRERKLAGRDENKCGSINAVCVLLVRRPGKGKFSEALLPFLIRPMPVILWEWNAGRHGLCKYLYIYLENPVYICNKNTE